MRQFLLWGLDNVKREWRFASTAHNVLKLLWACRPGAVSQVEVLGRPPALAPAAA